MTKTILISVFIHLLSFFAFGSPTAVTTENFLNITSEQEDCVFNFVKSRRPLFVTNKIENEKKPKIIYSHQIDLASYQFEFQKMQGFSPEVFLNYFNMLIEKVYLYTGLDRYMGDRSPLDSLAHEITHFFQFVESGRDLDLQKNDFNDDLETEAVRVQTLFRELKACQN